MEDDRKPLEEIRDLLQRQLDLMTRADERGLGQYQAARQTQLEQGRFYRRTVACGAVVVLLLLAYLFFFLRE